MATDLHDLSIAELSRLIAARTLSPVDLADALIQRSFPTHQAKETP